MTVMPARRTRHEPLSIETIELVASRFRTLGEPIRIQLLQALQRYRLGGAQRLREETHAVLLEQPARVRHSALLTSQVKGFFA